MPLPRQPTTDHPLSLNQPMPGEFSFSYPPQPHRGTYQTTNHLIQPPMLPKPLSVEPEPTLPDPTQSSVVARSTQIPLPKPMSPENIQPQPSTALTVHQLMVHLRQTHNSPRRHARSPDAPADQSAVTRGDLPVGIVSQTWYSMTPV